MKIIATAVVVPLILLAGCATTTTAQKVASCEEMERMMGTDERHEHSEYKGMGRSSMNLTHDQCRRILARHN